MGDPMFSDQTTQVSKIFVPQIRGRTTSIFLIEFIIFHRSLFLSFVQSESIDGGKAEDVILSQVWIYNFGLKLVILTHKNNFNPIFRPFSKNF